MTRWQAVLVDVVLAGLMALTPKIEDKDYRAAVMAMLAAAGAYATNKTSRSNPDGTPAQSAWEPKK